MERHGYLVVPFEGSRGSGPLRREVKKVFPASEGVADFCCATNRPPLRKASHIVALWVRI